MACLQCVSFGIAKNTDTAFILAVIKTTGSVTCYFPMAGEKSFLLLPAELRRGCGLSTAEVRNPYQVQHRAAHDTVRRKYSLTGISFSLLRLFVLCIAVLVQSHRVCVILPGVIWARILSSRPLEIPARAELNVSVLKTAYDSSPFEFMGISWVNTGSDAQDRLKYHCTAIPVAPLQSR